MTVENDFLVFSGGAGANVETQTQWVTDLATGGALVNGFQSGLAKSTQVNKAIRQASVIASMIAQLICDQTGQAAIDAGTVSTLEANLLSAIAISIFVADIGSVNALVATPAQTIAALVAGMTVRVKVAVTNTGASTLNIGGLGAVSILHPDGTALAAGDLTAGGIIELTYDGTHWQMPGSNHASQTQPGIIPVATSAQVAAGTDLTSALTAGTMQGAPMRISSVDNRVGGSYTWISASSTVVTALTPAANVYGTWIRSITDAGAAGCIVYADTSAPSGTTDTSHKAIFCANGTASSYNGAFFVPAGNGIYLANPASASNCCVTYDVLTSAPNF